MRVARWPFLREGLELARVQHGEKQWVPDDDLFEAEGRPTCYSLGDSQRERL